MLHALLIHGPATLLQVVAALGLTGFIAAGAGQLLLERVQARRGGVISLLEAPVELGYAGLALAVPASLLLGFAAR